jgi:hypothetical protein
MRIKYELLDKRIIYNILSQKNLIKCYKYPKQTIVIFRKIMIAYAMTPAFGTIVLQNYLLNILIIRISSYEKISHILC